MKLSCNRSALFFLTFSFTFSFARRWPYVTHTTQYQTAWIPLTFGRGFSVSDPNNIKSRRIISSKCLSLLLNDCEITWDGNPITQKEICIQPLPSFSFHNTFFCAQFDTAFQVKQMFSHREVQNNRYSFFPKDFFSDEYERQKKISKAIRSIFDQDLQTSPMLVRVLIGKLIANDQGTWELLSHNGYTLRPSTRAACIKRIGSNELVIQRKKNTLRINGKRYSASTLVIDPQHEFTTFNGKLYQGSFGITKQDDTYYLVNYIPLEAYLYAVVRSESWPGWPVEVNKAFAIASRSYVMAMIMRARKQGLWYDIKDTNEHQRYNLYGIHNSENVRTAVEQTRNIFLAYDNQPILAMFDSCCGGVVPAHISDFNFDMAPYLAREYACTHCKQCSIYSWQVAYDHDIFEQLMRKEAQTLKKLCNVHLVTDKAGLVNEVRLEDTKKTIPINGKKIYSLIQEIKSYCFTIAKKQEKIVISGRGYGHHLGMCQWGARQMVKEGWDYKKILLFYYPNTTFMKLT